MFNSKTNLSSTLGKVNKFIDDLKNGITSHEQEVEDLTKEINVMIGEKNDLMNEISQAKRLIGTLSGFNS